MITKNRRFGHIALGDSKKSFEDKYGSKITKREVESIGSRIAGLLASCHATLGPFTSIAITFVDSIPQGIERIIDTTKSHKGVYYALPSALVLESTDVEKLFIEAVFSTLRKMTQADGDFDKIDACEKRVLHHRNELQFLYRHEDTRRYLVKVLLSLLEPYPEFRQVYLQVKDKETGREATKLIAELNFMELDQLVVTIRIAQGKILIGPRKALVTEDFIQSYRNRGFKYPIEIEIEELLASDKVS